MKKEFIIGLATGLTVAGASLVLANSQIQAILNDQIKVTLNGQVQEFKDETTNETQYPITYKDRTYLPLRTVANLVGVDVDYDANSNTAMLDNKSNDENMSSELRYKKYLDNYKANLLKQLSFEDEPIISMSTKAACGIIDDNNQYIDDNSIMYQLDINSKLELSFDRKKISDNVLKAYVAYEGNGGPGLSIYFIKDDGSLNYYGYGKSTHNEPNLEWYQKNGLHKVELNNIVDFIVNSSISGSSICFVDIDGNIVHW